MGARMLDGTAVGLAIRNELRPAVDAFTARAGRPPGLGIVLTGSDPGSELYVGSKLKSAAQSGLRADLTRLPATARLADVFAAVDALNASDVHDAILVQSPLPAALGGDAERQVVDRIAVDKDVDGFHPMNVGRLVQGRPTLAACTPSGVIELLDRYQIPMAGRHAVVIGRSDIVGKPMALLLLHRHATVTICHSRTVDLPAVCRQADILVAAIGRPVFVTPAFVKPGATVIDVGTSKVDDRELIASLFPVGSKRRLAFEKHGALTLGDVHPAVAEVAGAMTPVPGGVGPLTIAMLLRNTLTAAEHRLAARC